MLLTLAVTLAEWRHSTRAATVNSVILARSTRENHQLRPACMGRHRPCWETVSVGGERFFAVLDIPCGVWEM